jgi:hypothetical protein
MYGVKKLMIRVPKYLIDLIEVTAKSSSIAESH